MPQLRAALARLQRPGTLVVAVRGSAGTGRVTAPHRHAPGQLFGATRGVLTVGTESGRWVVPATHAVWVPPHQLHSLRSHGAFEGASVYVAEAACADLPREACALRSSGLLREAIARAASWNDAPEDAGRRRIAELILDEIRTLPSEAIGLPAPRDPRIARVARALIESPGDARTLEEWAAWTGVAPRTLTRLFAAETGHSFGAWRQRARLMRALEMLAAGTPVTTVALDLGYDNVSAFIAMFKRAHGVTPARWFASATASS
jgi:AraC-like DNA-binding protein